MTTAEDDSIASFSSDLDSDTAVPAAKQPLPTFASTNSQSPPSTCWQHYDSNRARESRYTTSASEKPTTQTSVNVKIENNATLPNRTHLDENERQSPTTVTPSMSQLDDDDGGSNHDAGAAVAASTTVPIRIQQHNVTGASVHTPEYNPSGGGMKLNAKQAQAVQAIKDKKNVFLTGPAGTGKSVVLRKVLKYCSETYRPNQWVAVAPTGVTAIAIGGQTIHSFAGIGIPSEQEDFNKAWQGEKRQAWRELKIMVMEEISMIAGEFLDRLDSVVRQIRGVDAPFGGIQVLICGDFLQLPPIAESIENMAKMREFVNDPGTVHGNRGFAFQSYFWKEANLETIHLTEVFRQDNPQFVNVLSRIRRGLVGEPAKSFLAQCARPLTLPSKDIEPTRLYSKNVDVNRENMSELVRLDGDTHQFKAIDHVIAASFAKPGAEEKLWNSEFFRQTVAEDLLRLKVGAQVMLIKNDTLNRRTLVNGSRGVVVEFTNEQPEPPFNIPISIPKSNSDQARKEGIYPKVKFQNGETRILGMAEFTSRIVGVGQCIRIAVPLKLAWAITVHKSQGMTLDYVKIDLSGVFCKAQAYVALSRAKDEKCLELRNFSSRLVKADACALAFYDHPNIEINKWDHREKWTRAKVKVESVNNEPPSQEETKESKNQAWV
ncbi:unnamed protein product [Cylindrotheca closterium]|uniref:ATP-dependent DNA helicase n=1 Tax=Cylindrotheca closterium TaxID=2856 RepID=A0AAD2PXE4_9STRA|nr:unnamed protein product [Cylindrotheca closterium]